MFFTPEALEQATRLRVAEHRAARLAAARPASVIDLGCGIGGDLLAFARAGLTAAGVDLDPLRVALAQANLAALGLPGAVQVADATDDRRRAASARPSPTRPAAAPGDGSSTSRAGRRRGPSSWSCSPGDGVVKVAPGIPHDLVPDGVEAEWVSDGGDVKEAALWSRPRSRRRTAPARDRDRRRRAGHPHRRGRPLRGQPRPVRAWARFLYEPDGAVIRAGLVTAVAAGVGGGLARRAHRLRHRRRGVPHAVRPVLPGPGGAPLPREAAQGGAARARHRPLTIKKRGVDVVPEQLRKRLALSGDDEGTLVLTRVAGAGTALLVEPF